MTWILANPILSALIALSVLFGVVAGVQTTRLKVAQAETMQAEARIERLTADLYAQSKMVREWARQAEESRRRADEMWAKAKIFRVQRDGLANKLSRAELPQNECDALKVLIDVHRGVL